MRFATNAFGEGRVRGRNACTAEGEDGNAGAWVGKARARARTITRGRGKKEKENSLDLGDFQSDCRDERDKRGENKRRPKREEEDKKGEKERRTHGVQRDRRDAKRRAMADVAKRRGYSPTENLDSTHVSARRASPRRARLRGRWIFVFCFFVVCDDERREPGSPTSLGGFKYLRAEETGVLIPSSEMENIN